MFAKRRDILAVAGLFVMLSFLLGYTTGRGQRQDAETCIYYQLFPLIAEARRSPEAAELYLTLYEKRHLLPSNADTNQYSIRKAIETLEATDGTAKYLYERRMAHNGATGNTE